MPENQSPTPFENKTVVLFDILGFKNMVKTIDITSLGKEYEKVVDLTAAFNQTHLSRDPEYTDLKFLFPDLQGNASYCERFIFSDSIILISHDNSFISCLKTLVYAWRLSQGLVCSKFPYRGVAAYGPMYLNPAKNIFLGNPLTNAAELEKKLNFIGAVLHPSITENFPEFTECFQTNNSVFQELFYKYEIPYKSPCEDPLFKELHTINWRWNFVATQGTRQLLFPDTDEPPVLEKQKNTIQFIQEFKSKEKTYSYDAAVELQTFYCAKGPPTPTLPAHGDDL